MAVDSMSVLVPAGRVKKIDSNALEDQECFSYDYNKEKNMVLLSELPLVCPSARGIKVGEDGPPEGSPRF